MCVCVFIYFVYIYNGAYLINVKHTFIRHTIQSVELFIDIVKHTMLCPDSLYPDCLSSLYVSGIHICALSCEFY